jgi:lipopolysaccharide/colanic/teichoic acid biosynthesis glycosyltransferase
MDLTIATAAMGGLLPLLPFVALGIWLEDRGPILYRQERMGLDGVNQSRRRTSVGQRR